MQVCNHGNGRLFTGYYSWRVIASSLAWQSAWPCKMPLLRYLRVITCLQSEFNHLFLSLL